MSLVLNKAESDASGLAPPNERRASTPKPWWRTFSGFYTEMVNDGVRKWGLSRCVSSQTVAEQPLIAHSPKCSPAPSPPPAACCFLWQSLPPPLLPRPRGSRPCCHSTCCCPPAVHHEHRNRHYPAIRPHACPYSISPPSPRLLDFQTPLLAVRLMLFVFRSQVAMTLSCRLGIMHLTDDIWRVARSIYYNTRMVQLSLRRSFPIRSWADPLRFSQHSG